MNVLFIMPLALPSYLIQLAALSAFLKMRGHKVRYEELTVVGQDLSTDDFKRIDTAIEQFKPDLVGFSTYELSFEWIKQIAAHIKEGHAGVPIIVGGYYATLSPEEVISYPAIDMVCVGEGEFPMEEVLASLREGKIRTDVRNVWFKEGNTVVRNPLRNLNANLDELPFVDRELFASEKTKDGILEIMASRGCPFDCTNCSNHALKHIYQGKGHYLRYRSVEHVMREMESILSKEAYKMIHFMDDTFTANREWLDEFCVEYKNRIRIPFICNIRPEYCSVERLTKLKDAGCFSLSMGVEAGDEHIRRKVLQRNMPDAIIIEAFRNAKKVGIDRYSYNMVGLPYETTLSLLKTIWLNFKIAPEAIQTSVYYPFKGTVLGEECYRRGWVDLERKKQLKLYAHDSILNLPSVSRPMIRCAKWINTAMVLRSGNFSVLREGMNMLFKSAATRLKKSA
jgi:radical SAM superfamily enzyme YgiQ (UPF0313 family)